jgi:hypothetical protein
MSVFRGDVDNGLYDAFLVADGKHKLGIFDEVFL